MNTPDLPPSPPPASVLGRAASLYGTVLLFALGYATFSQQLDGLFGELPLAPQGLGAAVLIAAGLVATIRVGAKAWRPLARAAEAGARRLGPLGFWPALALAVLSGVAEELLFRGALWPQLRLAGTTCLFGVVYLIPRRDLWILPPLAAGVGVLLGLLRDGTGNLLPPMLAHVLLNAALLLWMASIARAALRTPDAGR